MITEMTRPECLSMIETERLARLACAKDGQPYVVPISFAAEGNTLYAFATVGRKIEWMRGNPAVCVQVDRIAALNDWRSVVMFGTYEEIPSDAAHERQRNEAWEVLRGRANWWEPAYTRTIGEKGERGLEPIYFRIHVETMTGHRMTPDDPSRG